MDSTETSNGGEPSGSSGGSNGSSAGSGGEATEPELSGVDLGGSPIYTRVQRLTNKQWENAVTDILRLSGPQGLGQLLKSPILGVTDFDNNEKLLFVDNTNFPDFELAAEAAAKLSTESADALGALYSGDDVEGFVRSLGRRAFRRPLTTDEETRYQAIFARGEELYGAGFANGAALVIRAMLQSPSFLYRSELGEADAPLNGFERASKLSFWLLGTTPSDALLDAAEAGELDSVDTLEATARSMLEDPRAIEMMRDFHGQLVRAHLYDSLDKVGVAGYEAALSTELRSVSDAFFDRVFSQNLGLPEILTSKRAYVTQRLATIYGLKPPTSDLQLQTLGASRSGYFMQLPFLMLRGDNEHSNPITRGTELQRMLLCKSLVDTSEAQPLPPPVPGESTRERAARITQNCGGCHRDYLDPLGFALESFDGMGRERETDNGKPVDTSASYPFAEGVASFTDGNELMNIMAKSTQVHTCYSKHLTGYALGRDLAEDDRPLLEALADVSRGDSLKELIVALVRSPTFGTRQEGIQ